MSIFDRIGDFFSRLWKKIKAALADLWDKLRPILAIIAIVVTLIMILPIGGLALPGILGVLAGSMAATPLLGLAIGLGVATLLDPEGVMSAIGKIADVAVAVGTAVASVGGAIIGGAVDGLMSTTGGKLLVFGGAALLGVWAWSKLKGDPASESATATLDTSSGVIAYDEEYIDEESDGEMLEGEYAVEYEGPADDEVIE